MTDRIAHDHPTVESIPATIQRVGGTTRPEIHIEDPIEAAADDVIRLTLDGHEYRARITERGETTLIRGAYDTPRLARTPGTGENHLLDWVAERNLEPGRTVHLDVIEPGFRYGLRGPGESATYTTGRPDASLADIADSLGDR